jgi:hypothetical protein
MRRFIANHIVSGQRVHLHSVVSIDDDGKLLGIDAFREETEGTIYVEGIIIIGNIRLPEKLHQIESVLDENLDITLGNLKKFMAENDLCPKAGERVTAVSADRFEKRAEVIAS